MAIIKEIPGLDPSPQHLLKFSHRKSYKAKNVIIHEGDVSGGLCYIIEGSVNVLAESETGEEIILAQLNKGDFFGEAGLFALENDEGRRSTRVVARVDSVIAEISYPGPHLVPTVSAGSLLSSF